MPQVPQSWIDKLLAIASEVEKDLYDHEKIHQLLGYIQSAESFKE